MIKSSSQFLLYAIIGVLISLGVLIAAEQFGFWKKKWRAEHKIIEYSAWSLEEIISKPPNYPSPIIKVAISPFQKGQKLPTLKTLDKSLYVDQKKLSFKTLKHHQTDFSGPISLKIFEDKLKETKILHPSCPSEKAIYWTECYGVYDFPWGAIYSGLWEKDKLNGPGKLRKENGGLYLGEFFNNRYNGCGILINTDGSIQAGIWQNGKLVEVTKFCNAKAIDLP